MSTRRSFSSISTTPETSSRNGTTSSEAKLVWRRCWASKGEMRTSRCTPRSAASSPKAYRPFTMKVADSSPASWPSVASSTSMVEAAPLGPAGVHAQHHLGPVLRVGAPGTGMDLGHGVAVVVGSGEQGAELERGQSAVEVVEHLFDLGAQRLVGLLLDELVEGLGVGQLLGQLGQLVEVVGDPAQLGGDLPGVVGVVPQAGFGGGLLQLGPPALPAGPCPGSARPRPPGRPTTPAARGCRRARARPEPRRPPSAGVISVGAVAELELLAAPAPARLVAADLLALGLHDGDLGLAVVGQLVGDPTLGAVPARASRPWPPPPPARPGVAAAKAAVMAPSPWTGSSAAR